MKKILIFSLLLSLPYSLSAAISPSAYKKARSNAETMVIKVRSVIKYRSRGSRILVKARAEILSIKRSSRRLRRGRWITIKYYTYAKVPRNLLGPAPTPILMKNQVYKVYLRRSRRGYYYVPAAGKQSFTLLF